MFFGDPVTAFSNIAHALRRSGRFTLLVWQSEDHNPWIGEFVEATVGMAAQPNSADDSNKRISFDRPEQVEALLARTGFVDVTFDPLAEPISFGPDPETALRFVCGIGFVKSLLNAVEADARPQALNMLRASLEAHTVADVVLHPSAMWLIGGRRA